MSSLPSTILLLSALLILLPSPARAFGAGEIPDFSYLNDKAFRHGDIENILAELAKTAGGAAAGGSLFGIAQSILGAATGGSKFTSQDVKKVYFGNWLRDYSQAMDIAGLSKLTADTLVLIVSVLGFLTFGFATEEFQVTPERLGVYLPVEHIDNPKGYAENEGDARQFHPKLRPPVNPEELEIDPRTGMKNYMATENRGWDTSTAHIRRTFRACIEHGRRSGGREGADLWEAYRLLGTGLHTMEDLLAHSNWCEIALRKMGHEQVFCHVGDNVLIDTPNGQAPPLVTGTFGSADFLHSLMGEATDHLSQASVVDLSKNLNNAAQNDTDSSLLRSLLEKLPIGGNNDEDKVSQADAMKEKAKAYQFNPDDVMPPDVQDQLLQLLKWRDDIYRDILSKIEMIPGLESLIDALTNALNAFVYTILAPYLTPVLQQVTSVLGEGSKAVIDSDDQYEVFNNPDASDPSHSLLSKDHFGLILNEPAGKTALVVVRYSVKLIVDAWYNNENPDRVIDQILEAFHHPYYNVGRSRIQQEMFEEMERWIGSLGPEDSERILDALTKESVRAGKNKRQGEEDDITSSNQVYGQVHGEAAHGSYAQGGYYGSKPSTDTQSKPQYGTGGYAPPQQSYGSGGGYSSQNQSRTSNAYGESNTSTYGHANETYGGGRQQQSYGGEYGAEESTYGRQQSSYESETTRPTGDDTYGSRRTYGGESKSTYDRPSYGQESTYGGEQRGSRHHAQQEEPAQGGYAPSYQPAYVTPSDDYGSSRTEGRTGGYGQSEYASQEQSYGSGYGSASESRGEYGSEEPTGYGRKQRDDGDGYGRSAESRGNAYASEETTGYGRRQRNEDDGYGSRRNEYSQESSGYGGRSEQTYGGGYGSSDTYGQEDSGRGEYGGKQRHHGRKHHEEQQSYGSGGYGGETESRGYGGGYGGGSESRNYGGGYGGGETENRGYGGGYSGGDGESRGGYGGGGYGGDETFGAERLNINDDGEERSHHGHHKKHRHHDDDD